MEVGILSENKTLILGTVDGETVSHMLQRATEARIRGDVIWGEAERISWLSVVLFVVGVAFAAATVLQAG